MLEFYGSILPRSPRLGSCALAPMQTQVIHPRPIGTACLERHTADGAAERICLETFPFTIGRNETADLHIPSSRVSREHAVVVKLAGAYRLQDLGSTNGTFVNGKPIEEAVLHDGDLLAFADEEFSFSAGSPAASRQTMTQVIDLAFDEGPEPDGPQSMIGEVRRLQEALTHCGIAHGYQPVVDLASGQVAGYEVMEPGNTEPPSTQRSVLAVDCRLTSRLRWLGRLLAVERALPWPSGQFLMVPLHASELGSPWLAESLEQLASVFGEPHQLTVQVPESAVSDNPCFDEFCDRLRQAGVSVAYSDFAANSSRIGQLRRKPPDLLKLSPGVTRGAQRRARLEAIVAAASAIGTRVMATGISRREEADLCRQSGCELAQGGFAGPPRTALSLSQDACRSARSIMPVSQG